MNRLRPLVVLLVLAALPAFAWARGCLEQGTPILTPGGAVAVERLAPGDLVISGNGPHASGVKVLAVTRVAPQEYVQLHVAGRTLRLTPEHPIQTALGVFREAGALRPGDAVLAWDGHQLKACAIQQATRIAAHLPAFNLLVEGGTYLANGISVHNKGCFLPDTPILRADGTETAIRDVRTGDRLMAFQPDGQLVTATVEDVLTRTVDDYYIVTTPQAILHVTGEHPFYVGAGTFQTLESLHVGDRIYAYDGSGLKPQPILKIEHIIARTTVYNLQTDQPHTYFANRVAVHNKGCLEEGTRILTPAGPTPIERLSPGDRVFAATAHGLFPMKVLATSRVLPEQYIEIRAVGRMLRATAEHPLQIAPGVFRQAASLRVGDTVWIQDRSLRSAPIEAIAHVPATRPAYNLLVEGGTYLANGIVAHNKGCFLADTPILRPDGTEILIASVRPGEKLMAFEPDGQVVTATVSEIITREVNTHFIVTAGRTTLRVTAEHPFYVGNGTFKTLDALHLGDSVYAYDGHGLSSQPITGIERVDGPVKVYNLRTDWPHTYFAGHIAVHNKGGGGFHSSGSHSSGFYGSRSHGRSTSGGFNTGGGSCMCVGIAILIFTVLGIKAAKSGTLSFSSGGELDLVYPPAAVADKAGKTTRMLEALVQRDPIMSPQTILQVARDTFLKLQECWQARNYSPMQPLLTYDLYSDHVGQLNSLVRNHEINLLEGLRIDRIELVHVRYTKHPELREVTALITATARDFYIDDRNRQFIRGDHAPAQFQEFWVFKWHNGTWCLRDIEQTRESQILHEDNVVEGVPGMLPPPPLPPPLPGVLLPSAPGSSGLERQLEQLARTDPLWNPDRMRIRVRQVFLATLLARQNGDPQGIPADDLFPALASTLRDAWQQRRTEGITLELRNLCVRKIDLVLIRNYGDNAKDEFTARISAHAQRVVRSNGQAIRYDPDVTAFTEYWTFGRLGGAWKLKEMLPPTQGQPLVALGSSEG